MAAAFSPDGQYVVTASLDGTSLIWDARTAKLVRVLRGHSQPVTDAAFSPDGAHVVTVSWDKTARIWNAESAQEIAVLKGHEGFIWEVTFSPSGRRFVTAGWDSARIWDVKTGNAVAVLKNFGGSAAFSSDERRLVTSSQGGRVRIWPLFLTTRELIADAKAFVSRCLTREQREAAFLELDPPQWCIELGKWPYQTQGWKDWLRYKHAEENLSWPDAPEQQSGHD
jgi:WD40 repeat protein